MASRRWDRTVPPGGAGAGVGRPRHDHHLVLGGILWVVRNGASWRDMPRRFGKWERAYRRYRLWSDTGLWERILSVLGSAPDRGATDVSL
jgi:transposase